MKNFFENTLEILVIIITILWQVLIGSIRFIFKLMGRFLKDVLKSVYGKIVAITASIILLGALSQLIIAP